jgi:hypothetical protein
MKKILIIVATFAISAYVHAATYNWSAYNNYFADTGDNDLTGTVYLFDANMYTVASVTAALSQSDTSVLNTSLGSAVLSYAAFNASGTSLGGNGIGSNSDGSSATMYAIVISEDGKNYWSSDEVTVALTDAIKGGGEAVFNFGSVDGVEWTAMSTKPIDPESGAVPEPTSGLLMLLGVAGLALRRKQA